MDRLRDTYERFSHDGWPVGGGCNPRVSQIWTMSTNHWKSRVNKHLMPWTMSPVKFQWPRHYSKLLSSPKKLGHMQAACEPLWWHQADNSVQMFVYIRLTCNWYGFPALIIAAINWLVWKKWTFSSISPWIIKRRFSLKKKKVNSFYSPSFMVLLMLL
jgi:hypothetical protein